MNHLLLPILLLAAAAASAQTGGGTEPVRASFGPADQQAGREAGQVFLPVTDVLPHVADGNYWKTTITLHNNSPTADNYTLTFYQGDGSPLELDFVGRGVRSVVDGSIPTWGTVVIETQGTSDSLKAGWARLESDGGYVKGYAIFRQRLPGRPFDFEAVVPMSASTESSYVLAFDNTQGFTTSLAICSTDKYYQTAVAVTIYDEAGVELSQHTIELPKLGHAAFATDVQWPSTINKRGTIRFRTYRASNPSVSGSTSVLGLRFNWTGPFTSTHTIEEY
ncbi:MAG: hypothetical protein K6T61_18230 [Bryobacteraceae bacterium]|nr:hypothetical protein [Bryobacteraceae bacterium]